MIWLLAIGDASAQEGGIVIPPTLQVSPIPELVWAWETFGWPGLILGCLGYLWWTGKKRSRWRGIPVRVRVELTPESGDIIRQAIRGKRPPSQMIRERMAAQREAARLLGIDPDADNSGDDETTTPTESGQRGEP